MENKQLINLTSKLAGTVALASVGSLAFAFNADAATLFTDSDSFTNELTELQGMPVLTVDKYVPAANETITEVQVMVMASLTSSGTITNTGNEADSFTILTVANLFELEPSENPPSTLLPFPAFTTIGSQNYTLAPGASAPFGLSGPFTIPGTQNQSFTSAGDIASLTGPGTINFAPTTQIFTIIQGGGGNIITAIQTVADAEVSIKYFGETITPPPGTPEPSALLGLGILTGLGFIGRKKASKKS